MSADWEEINQIFHRALECRDEDRAEFIARACRDNPALLKEVQSLIDLQAESHSFLEMPVMRIDLSPQFNRWQEQIVDANDSRSEKGSASTKSLIGQILDEKYHIQELCGRGGMGTVYRAVHTGTGRKVAVKVIAPELAGNREFIERFRREAKTIGMLRHPNIVNVTDFGITETDKQTVAYLVMEYLEGGTLAARLKKEGPLPTNEAVAILSQTCAAIGEAHRLGILHRDLKPENIWLESSITGSNVRVLDFGIAQLQDFFASEPQPSQPSLSETVFDHPPASVTEAETLIMNMDEGQLTRAGTVMGTPKYMSPEQCRGENLSNASDIYSLGVIAYQMFTGELPFTGTVEELLSQHRAVLPASLREKKRAVPAAIDSVICQALAKEPSARPRTAEAFAFQLQLHIEGNQWIRRLTNSLSHRHRVRLALIAAQVQWPGWLLTCLLLFAAVKLPGMPAAMSILVFGALWLTVIFTTLFGNNVLTAASALLVEREVEKKDSDARTIVSGVRERLSDLTRASIMEVSSLARKLVSFNTSDLKRWSDSTLTIPALVGEGLSREEAGRRSETLIASIRRRATYPFFNRLLALGLTLTAWQVIALLFGFLLDGGIRRTNDKLIIWIPVTMAICQLAFWVNLKSSIEQAALYLGARQALGEVEAETPDMALRLESKKHIGWMPHPKTFIWTCFLITILAGMQFFKFSVMPVFIRGGDVHAVKALNASGVPLPFWSGWFSPLLGSIVYYPEMTELVLDKGASINAEMVLSGSWTPPGIGQVAMTPLMAALTAGAPDTARLLIERGADIHAQDSIGRTPMTIAITYCPQAIEPILSAGVDINEETRFGTPLLTAARYQWFYPESTYSGRQIRERENAVRILVDNGADPNRSDSEGRTPLMVMSMEKRRDRVVTLVGESLLNAGANIDATDSKGRTPLMYAVTYQNAAAVSWLIVRGANIKVKDGSGTTALEMAKQSGNEGITRLLLPPSTQENPQ